jgi:hypothetical protein
MIPVSTLKITDESFATGSQFGSSEIIGYAYLTDFMTDAFFERDRKSRGTEVAADCHPF